LPAAVAPVLVGTALAWHEGSFDPWAAAICLGFALLIQIGTNFANDYYDFVKGADAVFVFWPREKNGAYAAHLLREIAARLDELNKEDK
jgi:1,4-dihydroxy-2-naphthoate octaprenyltransferase